MHTIHAPCISPGSSTIDLSLSLTSPGSSTIDQLQKVMELTGFPSAAEIAAMDSPFAATMLQSLPATPPPPADVWELRFPSASADAVDLMRRLLSFDPKGRPSAAEALRHPYVAQFHDPGSETDAARKVQCAIDDNAKKSTAVYRERLYHEITKMKRRNKEAKAERKAEKAGGGGRENRAPRQ